MKDLQVYLLAAGLGKRSGGPKAWRPYEETTLLERQIGFLLKHFPAEQVTVSIQKDWNSRCEKISPGVRWVAADPLASPLGTFQTLLASSPMTRWSFFYHVDMPVWEAALFKELAKNIASAEKHGVEAVAPVCGGRKGHPIVLSPKLAPLIAALDPAKDRLDFWLRTRKEKTVEAPFLCIHENWNEAIPRG